MAGFDLTSTFKSAKYNYSFTGDKGNIYNVDIHEFDYDNTVSGLNSIELSGRGAVQTRWSHSGEDEYSPLLTSSTTLTLFDTGEALAGDLIGGLDDVEDKYLLVIRQTSSIKWIGRIDPEAINFREDGPVVLSITASDGLGRLDKEPYIVDFTGTGPVSGVESFTSILSEILDTTGFDLDYYVSSSFYPKTDPVLAATDNPLENTYVDRINFTSDDDAQGAVSKLSVLKAVCTTWGAKIFQADGAWHITQVNHLSASSYRRWRYDTDGVAKIVDSHASNVYEDISPRVTFSDNTLVRTFSNASFLKGHSASVVKYAHGPVQVLRFPGFDPVSAEDAKLYWGGEYSWSRNGTAKLDNVEAGDWGMRIDTVDGDVSGTTGYDPLTVWAIAGNGDDTSGSFTTLIGGNTSSQTSDTIPSGTVLNLEVDVQVRRDDANTNEVYSPPGSVLIQVKHTGATTQYLHQDGFQSVSWSTTPNWMVFGGAALGGSSSQLFLNQWTSILLKMEALDSDGTLTMTLGPYIEDSATPKADYAIYGTAQLNPNLPDGTLNYRATNTVNYISRSKPNFKETMTTMGDGPTSLNRGAMFTSTSKADLTADWEESTSGHSGTDTNEDHALVLGRAILTSMNKVRRIHSSAYPGHTSILTPLDVLSRGYIMPTWELSVNWIPEFSEGSWYHADENSFTDDLEVGLYEGTEGSRSLNAMSDQVGFTLNQLSQTFFSENSKRITVTTEDIVAGATTADVDVEAIGEALLNNDDQVILIGYDLSLHRLNLTQDQASGDTTLYFDDPDNPGSNYDFPLNIPAGASIFYGDKEMLTLARLGEQGFKVTVLGAALGLVDGAQSGTLTQLTVSDWIASVPSGTTIALDDGTELTLSADANPNDTTIYFNSTSVNASDNEEVVSGSRADLSVTAAQVAINVSDISGNTGNISVNSGNISTNVTNISTNDGEILANTGLINVESGRIDLQIERSGDRIGVITSASSGATLTLSGGINDDLFDGDSVLIIDKSTGTIQKREVASDAAQSATSFTVTSAVTVAVDDVVYYGSVAGLRVDFDGISVLNTHLKSNWNGVVNSSGVITTPGTAGWIITNQGNAEFNNVSIRGELDVSDIVGDLTVTDGSIIVNMDDTVTAATKLPLSFYDENGATDVLTWSYNPYVTNIDWVMYNSNEAGVFIFQAQNSGSNQADLSLWPAGLTTITNSVSWVEANDSLIINGSVFSGDQDDRFALMSMGKPSYYEYHLAGYGTSSFYTKTSNTTVANTVTKTSLIGTGSGTNTIPADALATGSTIRVTAGGAYSSSAGNTLNLTIDIDGTTVFSRPVSFSSAVSGYGWTFDSLVTVRSDTTAISSGSLIYNDSTGGQLSANNTTTTTTISSVSGGTSVVTLNATWTTANASSSVTCSNLNIEVHRAN